MTSKFTVNAYLPLAMSVTCASLIYLIIRKGFTANQNAATPFGAYAFLFLFIAILLLMVFGELRKKALQVTINPGEILTQSFLGKGSTKRYEIRKLDGFMLTVQRSRYRKNEAIILMQNKQKIALLSSFYLDNYPEIKQELEGQLTYLGFEKHSVIDELKNLFN